jgi:hypothetical protein
VLCGKYSTYRVAVGERDGKGLGMVALFKRNKPLRMEEGGGEVKHLGETVQ